MEENNVEPKKLTYESTGVDYSQMDPYKKQAQLAAAGTAHHLERFGFKELGWTRGESVYLVETPTNYLGFVVEGLGTKSLVADSLLKVAKKVEHLTGKTFYDHVARCNAAMAFNDMITLGALPVVYSQYLAVGNSAWFKNKKRASDLIEGTKKACEVARCSWGGGETPTLKGIVINGTADLAGATMGVINNKKHLIDPANIENGDRIVLFASSGIHANGLTLARAIAKKLPKGYLTEVSNGRTFGEMLLDPTYIYVRLVEDCLNAGINIHYAVNITGHGWRKLMRAPQPFTYVIERLPKELPIFEFIQEHGPLDDKEAYGNLNMGAGFALYIPRLQVGKVLQIAASLGFEGTDAGYIVMTKEKKVVIQPKSLEYAGSTLAVR